MYNSINEVFLRLLNKQPFNQDMTTVHMNERQSTSKDVSLNFSDCPPKPHKINIVCACSVAFMQR